MTTTTPPQPAVRRTIDLSRTFAAPRELLYRMWTDGEQMKQWSAPRGFTITHAEGEPRAGGSYRTCMRKPDGEELWLHGTYREVTPNERLVFTHVWEEDEGVPEHETLVTVTFSDAGTGQTRMDFHQENFKSEESQHGHRAGWSECFDLLEEHLKTAKDSGKN